MSIYPPHGLDKLQTRDMFELYPFFAAFKIIVFHAFSNTNDFCVLTDF